MQNSTLNYSIKEKCICHFCDDSINNKSICYFLSCFYFFLPISSLPSHPLSAVPSRPRRTNRRFPAYLSLLKGHKQGVITDASGKYSINAKKGTIIIFSGVGYQTLEVKVAGPVLDVELDAKQNSLNEVVVIGYGTSTRANVTTAVSKIDPKVVPQGANSSVAELDVRSFRRLDSSTVKYAARR